MPVNRMYEDELKDQPDYYEDVTQPYLKDDLPPEQSYPALSLAPKSVLRDPNKQLPADRSPVDYPVGDSRLDAERGQRYKAKVYTEQLYDALNKGEDIKTAREKASNLAMMADVGQALSGMATAQSVARGGPGADKSIYEGIRQRAATLPREAEEDRKAKITDYLTKRKLGQEDVAALKTAGQEDRIIKMRDPESDVSRSYQQLLRATLPQESLSKLVGTDPITGDEYDHISTLSAEDAIGYMKMYSPIATLNMNTQFKNQDLALRAAGIGLKETEVENKNRLGMDALEQKGALAAQSKEERAPLVQAKIDLLNAQAKKAAMTPKEKASATQGEGLGTKQELAISKEYRSHPQTKNTDEMSRQVANIKSYAQNPSAAGDISLIFSFMKMVDPQSTVREGEFATAQNAAGVPDQIRNIFNRAIEGERLTPEQRADFARQAETQWKNQVTNQKRIYDQYADTAKRYGSDPELVLGKFPFQTEENKTQGFRPYNPKITPDDQSALEWIHSPNSKNDPNYQRIYNSLKSRGLL